MGDFDGDGYADILVGAPDSARTIERWDGSAITGSAGDRRNYAGRVYLIYGPIDESLPKRAGRSSRVSLGQNWGDFDDCDVSGTEGYLRADAWEWYNAFDITGEPRYETTNTNDVSDETDIATTTTTPRIEGIVFQGSYGLYTSSSTTGTTYVNMPVHNISSRGFHDVNGNGTKDSGDLGAVNGHYGRVDTMAELGYDAADVNWSASGTTCEGTAYASRGADQGEYERMGFTARFIGDVNDDGCADIAMSSQEFDEFQPVDSDADGNIDSGRGVVMIGGVAHRYQPMNDGRLYVIFGQGEGNGLPRYTGAFDLAGGPTFNSSGAPAAPANASQMNVTKGAGFDPESLQGVVLKSSKVHALFGKDCAALPGLNIDLGVFGVQKRSFNGDSVDDFVVASASFDADLTEMFGPGTSYPDWRTLSCSHTGTDPIDDLGLETGWGYTAIIYGKALGYDVQDEGESLSGVGSGGTITIAPSLNPWSADDSFLMPDVLDERDGGACPPSNKPSGVYFVGGQQFGYLAYGAAAGDFDGDTYPDVVLGHSRYGGSRGRAYIAFGRADGFLNSPHTDHPSAWLMTTNGFTHDGTSTSGYDPQYWIDLEIASASAEDFHQWDPTANGGAGNASDVLAEITGAVNPGPEHDTDPAYPTSFSNIGLNGGWAVWSAGDVDADGYADVLIGAPSEDLLLSGAATVSDAPRGRTYLVYGYSVPRGASDTNGGDQCIFPITTGGIRKGYTLDLATGDASWESGSASAVTDVAIFRGEHNGDHAGYSVASAGDINDDGYADFLIGADWADHPDAHHAAGSYTGSDENCGGTATDGCFHSTCHTPFCTDGTPGHNIRDIAEIFDRVSYTSATYSGTAINADSGFDSAASPWFDYTDFNSWDPSSTGYVNTEGLFIDVNQDGKYDPVNDIRGVPIDLNSGSETEGFHRDLGVAYLIYGSGTRFTGDQELSTVGHSGGIDGLAIWGMTGRGADDLGGGGTSPFRRFDAPEFGRALAGGQYFDALNPGVCDLNDDGDTDFLIGAPRMSRPNGSQPFPVSKIGGVVAYYGWTAETEVSVPSLGDYLDMLAGGSAKDLNGDGRVDIEDLRMVIEAE